MGGGGGSQASVREVRVAWEFRQGLLLCTVHTVFKFLEAQGGWYLGHLSRHS